MLRAVWQEACLNMVMGRKPVMRCSVNPYHITARTNNKDWFDLEMDDVFNIYCKSLKESKLRYKIKVHAFVLMNNHFHLMASTPLANISEFLQYFMTQTSKEIAKRSNRINKVYGSRSYKSLIKTEEYFAHCLKYIYLNPVRAGISVNAESYRWSTISDAKNVIAQLCEKPTFGHDILLPENKQDFLKWINEGFLEEDFQCIRRASKRTLFSIKATGNYRKLKTLTLPVFFS